VGNDDKSLSSTVMSLQNAPNIDSCVDRILYWVGTIQASDEPTTDEFWNAYINIKSSTKQLFPEEKRKMSQVVL